MLCQKIKYVYVCFYPQLDNSPPRGELFFMRKNNGA